MKSDTRNNYHKPGMRTEKQGRRSAAPVREMRTQKEQTVQRSPVQRRMHAAHFLATRFLLNALDAIMWLSQRY